MVEEERKKIEDRRGERKRMTVEEDIERRRWLKRREKEKGD